MKWSHVFLLFVALDASVARYISSPFPAGSENPVVALMALDAPCFSGSRMAGMPPCPVSWW